MTLAQWMGAGAGILLLAFISFALQALKAKRSQASPEFKAITREVAIDTAVLGAALGLLLLGLVEAASSLAAKLSAAFALRAQLAMSFGLFGVFGGALAFVIWTCSRRSSRWSEHLKNVVPLIDFLKYDPANRILAPNLDENRATAVLKNLQVITAREDVIAVRVGLLPDDGYQSDRVLIKTFAPVDVISRWSELLQTECQTISTRRYEINGRRRKVRNLLFLWD